MFIVTGENLRSALCIMCTLPGLYNQHPKVGQFSFTITFPNNPVQYTCNRVKFKVLSVAFLLLISIFFPCGVLFALSTLKGRRSKKVTYPDIISRDMGFRREDPMAAMHDYEYWCGVVDFMSTEVKR